MIFRHEYLEQLIKFKDTDFIKVITGVRLLNEGVQESQIVVTNFESYESQVLRTEEKLYDFFGGRLDKSSKYYILLAEIQIAEGWQRIVNGLRVSYDCDIVITGSNAKLLSSELAAILSGRYAELPVYPLSFKEFLSAKGIEAQSRFTDQAFREYEAYDGFPSVVNGEKAIKDTILSGIFDTIVLNDAAFRAGVKDAAVLKSMIGFLSDNAGQLVSPAKIADTLEIEGLSTNSCTVSHYLELLENSFLFYRVRQYDIRGRGYLKTTGKYFIADSGLRRNAAGQKSGNYSSRLENIVFLELLRRGYQVDAGRLENKETDFIA